MDNLNQYTYLREIIQIPKRPWDYIEDKENTGDLINPNKDPVSEDSPYRDPKPTSNKQKDPPHKEDDKNNPQKRKKIVN